MPTFSASITALFLLGVPAAMAAQAQSGGKISHDRSTARTERFTDRWLTRSVRGFSPTLKTTGRPTSNGAEQFSTDDARYHLHPCTTDRAWRSATSSSCGTGRSYRTEWLRLDPPPAIGGGSPVEAPARAMGPRWQRGIPKDGSGTGAEAEHAKIAVGAKVVRREPGMPTRPAHGPRLVSHDSAGVGS